MPRYPRTVSSSHTDIVLTPDGGADLEIRAQSTDPMQAQRDAATLTQRFSDAASVKVAILRIGRVMMGPMGDTSRRANAAPADEYDRGAARTTSA